MARPEASEYARSYENYIRLVPEEDVVEAMRSELARTLEVLRAVPEDESLRRHPPYSWSIRQVVGHLSDSERVFGYRALRFARGDATPLPGFDENVYAAAAQSDRIALSDLADEFEGLRRSHLGLFAGLPEDAWDRRGVANQAEISVRALAYAVVGHERHHMGIVRKRLGRS
jgi:hypothetical protein